MTLSKAATHLWLLAILAMGLAGVSLGQESASMPPHDMPGLHDSGGLIDRETKWLVAQFGFAGLILLVWWIDRKDLQKQLSTGEGQAVVLKKWEESATAHIAAFKDINDRNMGAFREAMGAMQKVAEEAKDNAVMCATVNTRVAERLDYLSKERSAP